MDDFYTCTTITLGKYVEGGDYKYDLERAQNLAEAFCMWCDLDYYNEEDNWLTIKISYVSDSIFVPDYLSTIKFFALYSGYSIMRQDYTTKPLDD